MITACRSKFMNERQTMISHVMYCTIWYYLYNLKNMKKTHGGVLLLVKPATLLKSNTPPWLFFTFFKLRKWYQIAQSITYIHPYAYYV